MNASLPPPAQRFPLRGPGGSVHHDEMRTKGLVWLLAAFGPVLLAVSLTIPDRTAAHAHDWVNEVYPNLVMGALLPLLGALILSRLPRHPVGWLFLSCGLVSSFTLAVYAYAAYGLVEHPGSLPLALGAGEAVRSFLFAVAPNDPMTLLTAAATVLTVAAIACYFPARRSSRVDAISALRAE